MLFMMPAISEAARRGMVLRGIAFGAWWTRTVGELSSIHQRFCWMPTNIVFYGTSTIRHLHSGSFVREIVFGMKSLNGK
jgi:hypothetical protein